MTIGTIGIGPSTAAPSDSGSATFQGKAQVRYGKGLNLRGEFPGNTGASVAIMQKKVGQSSYRQVASTRTNANGRWSTRVKPKLTGTWMAELADPPATVGAQAASQSQSRSKRIRVRSVTKVRPAKRNVKAGETIRMTGGVKPAGERQVKVNVGSKTIRTRANKRGKFSVKWSAPAAGEYSVKARSRSNMFASGSKDSGPRVTAFRSAQASWYGPGLYGNRTACGQTLSASTEGVANKTLPCGTKLTLRYNGRSVTTRVIDRGPYHGNREFDLTYATKRELGFGDTGSILVSR